MTCWLLRIPVPRSRPTARIQETRSLSAQAATFAVPGHMSPGKAPLREWILPMDHGYEKPTGRLTYLLIIFRFVAAMVKVPPFW